MADRPKIEAAKSPRILIALIAQALAGTGTLAVWQVLPWAELARPTLAWLLVGDGLAAAAIGAYLGLRWWWAPLNFLIPPGIAAMLTLAVPSSVYFALFAVLALVFWNSSGERVPLYLTNARTAEALARLLPKTTGATFIDLGCGPGGLVRRLAGLRPDMQFTGVESAPLVFALAWLASRVRRHSNLRLRRANLWDQNLADYDVVYCFLSPAPMPRLMAKARREMRPGTRLISNSFAPDGDDPDREVDIGDWRTSRLLIWEISASVAPTETRKA